MLGDDLASIYSPRGVGQYVHFNVVQIQIQGNQQ